MKKLIPTILIALATVGCATPNEVRTKTAELELTSNHPAKQVAVCIADRWENSGPLGGTIPISMRPTTDGYTVSWRNEALGHTALMADVSDTQNGSATRYFKYVVAGAGSFDKAVRECQ